MKSVNILLHIDDEQLQHLSPEELEQLGTTISNSVNQTARTMLLSFGDYDVQSNDVVKVYYKTEQYADPNDLYI